MWGWGSSNLLANFLLEVIIQRHLGCLAAGWLAIDGKMCASLSTLGAVQSRCVPSRVGSECADGPDCAVCLQGHHSMVAACPLHWHHKSSPGSPQSSMASVVGSMLALSCSLQAARTAAAPAVRRLLPLLPRQLPAMGQAASLFGGRQQARGLGATTAAAAKKSAAFDKPTEVRGRAAQRLAAWAGLAG